MLTRYAVAVAALALLAPLCPAQQTTRSLYHDTLVQPKVAFPPGGTALRSRAIELDLGAIVGASNEARVGFELFEGARHVAVPVDVESAYGGGILWRGRIDGQPESEVLLSIVGTVATGTIRTADRLHRIRYAGNGVHWLTEEDESAFARCATEPGPGAPRSTSSPATSEAAAAPNVDVMVVFSPAARNAVGGQGAMLSLINLAVTETNDAYGASSVNQRLRLVHAQVMQGYEEPSGMGTILSELRDKNDGELDEVHALRDQYGADAVAMICANGQYCGIANLMGTPSASFESSAFSVTNYGCATGYYSFGHELGHNFGSTHDRGNGSGGSYSYSFGFRTANSQYRTIMAYAPGTRVKRFSSPTSMWNGFTLGTSTEDNARSMNNTAPIVSAWRMAAAAPPTLSVTNLTAGQTAMFTGAGNGTTNAVLIGMSLTGGGPTSTTFGPALLSPPFSILGELVSSEGGRIRLSTPVPPGLSGMNIWFQSVNLVTSQLSNGIATTVN